jgi:UDP-N-acetylglucosamine--N-acetylmuramyl-(pentapeptide) pyrophosphoryl-undecaprenol N-acetylglucosamine transferase
VRLLIAGGGTGGHLFPGIAVAEEFLAREGGSEVLFVGTERGIEARVLPRLGFRLECIDAAGIRGKGLFPQLKGISMLLYGYAQSRKILKSFAPDIVLGVGGYASGPVVLAARGLQIRRFIHEQNAIPGMTNKVLAKIAESVFISLEESRKFFPKERTVLTGNPLRRQILEAIGRGEDRSGMRDGFHILVFGGSRGAHAINMNLIAALPHLVGHGKRLTVTHQTGPDDLEQVAGAYRGAGVNGQVIPFIDDMAAAYREADLIVCRAGATTIAEVTACGKACVFIPFPHAVDDHQRKNAEAVAARGAGVCLLQRELSETTLAELLLGLLRDREALATMAARARELGRPDAADRVAEEILAVVGRAR